jgi:HlyD family secretion protein
MQSLCFLSRLYLRNGYHQDFYRKIKEIEIFIRFRRQNLKKRLILAVFVILLMVAGALVYWGQKREQAAELYYSGTIEATQANLAFQVSGRVKEVITDEGKMVRQGQVLARLEREEFLARQKQAEAHLYQARDLLEQKKALLELTQKTVPAEVERAEAAVKGAEAQLAELKAGYRTQEVERSRLALLKAEAAMEEARRDKERIDRLFKEGIVAERDKDSADLKYQIALKDYESANEAYEAYREGYRKETIETAKSKFEESKASLRQARSQLKKIEVAEKELKVAESQVLAVESELRVAEIQLGHTVLKAPFEGIVVSRNVEPGEVVSPGREVISVADLSEVDLKIFVGEKMIGMVRPGQEAEVKVDTFKDKIYKGRVSFISPEAEFTPKIIQTHKERVKLVYLVKVTIANPNFELKPGMPADAWLK